MYGVAHKGRWLLNEPKRRGARRKLNRIKGVFFGVDPVGRWWRHTPWTRTYTRTVWFCAVVHPSCWWRGCCGVLCRFARWARSRCDAVLAYGQRGVARRPQSRARSRPPIHPWLGSVGWKCAAAPCWTFVRAGGSFARCHRLSHRTRPTNYFGRRSDDLNQEAGFCVNGA